MHVNSFERILNLSMGDCHSHRRHQTDGLDRAFIHAKIAVKAHFRVADYWHFTLIASKIDIFRTDINTRPACRAQISINYWRHFSSP
jgi:hypothetical protein